MKLQFIYITISQLSVLAPIAAGAIYYKKLPLSFRLFFWFFVFSLIAEAQAYIVNRILHQYNTPGMHVFCLVEFWAYSMMYYFHFKKNSKMRQLIAINAVILTGLAFAEAFVFGGLLQQPTVSRSYSSVFIVLYTLIALYSLFQREGTRYSWQYPIFWVCIGALIYFATNFLYFMLKKWLLINAPEIEKFSYHSHAAFNIIGNCLFAQSFRMFRKWETT